MKKWTFLAGALAVTLSLAAVGSAEESSRMGDFASRLKKHAPEQTEMAAEPAAQESDGVSFGPELRISDTFFEKVRSSAYLQEKSYSKDANVMIELKNISGKTLYPKSATVRACGADGTVIEEETYSSYGPEMVEDGASLFVWDWFYGFEGNLSDISYFEVDIETETSSYRTYANIPAQAMVSDGVAYALVENATEDDLYGLGATIVMENAEGVLLDVCNIETGNAVGIFPGSVMILRDNAKDYAQDAPLAEATATAYAQYEAE